MIPKIIHYCWLSGDPIPEKLQKCMESWKTYLPDYEFVLWDRNRFDINSTLWTKQAFEAKKYAFAADYIRLYAVYNYGGIYMDMDVEVVKNFDDLLEQEYFIGFESDKRIEAGIFGASKNLSYMKDCLDYYKDRQFIKEDNSFDTNPLPNIMYNVMSDKYRISNRNSIEIKKKSDEDNTFYIFPYEYLTAKSYSTGKINVTKKTYSIHHYAGSWQPLSFRLRTKLYRFISGNPLLYFIYKNTYRKIKSL